MLNGYIYVHVDLGSGGVRVRASRRRVDDSHWHEFLLRRSGRDGRVTVDGANAEFKTPGTYYKICICDFEESWIISPQFIIVNNMKADRDVIPLGEEFRFLMGNIFFDW